MVIFQRAIESRIRERLFKENMIVLYGPRQAGKTTLAKKLIAEFGDDGAYYDCQLAHVRQHFVVGKPEKLLPLTDKKRVVVFDEAQTITDIGTILKVYHDTYPGTQIIATGSSSFDLANRIVEPMTGRAIEFVLLPLSLPEITSVQEISRHDLTDILLYGSYPRVVAAETKEEKEEAIKAIATNYLYKDVFVFETIRNPKIFEDLIKALALQIGSTVSLNELAETVGATRATINRYLRLLEQAFIIKRVYAFSNNPRTEIKKAFKIFFLDTGVRNAIIDIISPMDSRTDRGGIFENFVVNEHLKQGTLEISPPEIMFWRMRDGTEIDIIEKHGSAIAAFECKWSAKDVSFTAFKKKYPEATTSLVTPDTLLNAD
jgi:predicted AAA+ superfamily ATPase